MSGISHIGQSSSDAGRAGAIGLYARATPGHAERLAATIEQLRGAAAAHAGRIVQATSLGAEDMVLTDLIARHRLPIALGTLETGMLHPETVALIGRIEARYGLAVEVYRPVEEAVVDFVARHGALPMYDSLALRKACCGLRKLEPLGRLLAGRDAWVTGMRREQSANRGSVAAREQDDQGRVKLNPLVEWTWADVWHYIAEHQVPYNPLHDAFMPSIGCAPCTRAIAVGEDFRAGRWWWEDEGAKECGLHVRDDGAPAVPVPVPFSVADPATATANATATATAAPAVPAVPAEELSPLGPTR